MIYNHSLGNAMFRNKLILLSTILLFSLKLYSGESDSKKIARVTHPLELHDSCYAGFFVGEGGEDHWRLNGTFGWQVQEQFLLKFSAEYLAGKNTFYSYYGDCRPWVHQAGVGAEAAYLLCSRWLESINLGVVYSHAFNKSLDKIYAPGGELISNKRVAGSDAVDFNFGGTIPTFCQGTLALYGTYQHVEYDRRIQDKLIVKGLGFGFYLNQPINHCSTLYFQGDFQHAYDYYEAGMNWKNQSKWGLLTTGFFVANVRGKHELTHENRIGLSFGFDFGRKDCCRKTCCSRNRLAEWVQRPAIYRPKVLAIIDEQECIPPSVVTSTQSYSLPGNNAFSINVAPQFAGTDLTFAASNLPDGWSIDPTTGIISGTTTSSGSVNITITATNPCGSAQAIAAVQWGLY